MTSIYKLEERIMTCWNLVDDTALLSDFINKDSSFLPLSDYQKETLTSLLKGLNSLYDIKFSNLFEAFEESCAEFSTLRKQLSLYTDASLQEAMDMQELEIKDLEYTLTQERQHYKELQTKLAQADHIISRLTNKSHDFDEDRMDIIGQNGNDGLHYSSTAEWEGEPPTGYEKKPKVEYFIEPLHYPLGMYKLYSTIATDFGGVAINYITEGTLEDVDKIKQKLEKGDTKPWSGNPQGGYNLYGEPRE